MTKIERIEKLQRLWKAKRQNTGAKFTKDWYIAHGVEEGLEMAIAIFNESCSWCKDTDKLPTVRFCRHCGRALSQR